MLLQVCKLVIHVYTSEHGLVNKTCFSSGISFISHLPHSPLYSCHVPASTRRLWARNQNHAMLLCLCMSKRYVRSATAPLVIVVIRHSFVLKRRQCTGCAGWRRNMDWKGLGGTTGGVCGGLQVSARGALQGVLRGSIQGGVASTS